MICTIFSFVASFSISPCRAADIYADKSKLYLNGEIRAGDAERMALALSKMPRASYLTVNSPGGDIREALRLAQLVRRSRIGVLVSKGGYCVSACFFIYLEGYWRIAYSAQEDGTLLPFEKRQKRFGMVGIHRPYLKSTDGGVKSIQSQDDLMRAARSHLILKSIPQYLIDEMMGRPSNDIYWLKERDLEALGEHDPGVEEALIAKCGYKRTGAMVDENWSTEKRDLLTHCSLDYWDQEFLPSQQKFLNDLENGRRPWIKQ